MAGRGVLHPRVSEILVLPRGGAAKMRALHSWGAAFPRAPADGGPAPGPESAAEESDEIRRKIPPCSRGAGRLQTRRVRVRVRVRVGRAGQRGGCRPLTGFVVGPWRALCPLRARLEGGGAERSGAEQSRAEQSRAEQSRAEQSGRELPTATSPSRPRAARPSRLQQKPPTAHYPTPSPSIPPQSPRGTARLLRPARTTPDEDSSGGRMERDIALITCTMPVPPRVYSPPSAAVPFSHRSPHPPLSATSDAPGANGAAVLLSRTSTCVGDRGGSPKRTRGVRMGSTYDDDSGLASSTVVLRPINPVRDVVPPPRLRGASMSAVADGSSHTMNPQDKFLTPRAPPPLPSSLPRLNTSTALLSKKRSERSLSAKAEKSARSPWTFFGIRAPALSPSSPVDRRGRSASSGKPAPARRKSSAASLDDAADPRQVRSYPQTRDCSPSSGAPSRSRDPSPPRHPRPDSTYSPALLEIPDEIAEDAEDDANFAYQRRISLAEKAILTQLAPPPASRGPLAPHRPGAARDTQKPLPQIPQLARENIILSPLPRLHLAPSSDNLPASRFSFSTLASPVASPTDSQFSWSSAHSPPSVTSDIDADGDSGCGDAFTYSPVVAESPGRASSGYHAWPGGGYASEWAPSSPSPKAAKRVTFGAGNETPAYLRLDERFTATDGRDGVPTRYDQRRVAPPSDTLLEPDLGHETSETGAQAPHRGLTFLPSPG
ncbi:hypothetical protein B2J93_1176 [Marssonina coronariae]|uniref:Uncharacterized protein n=1 Tax=Diplocarpon coronariae TaxID=2795749 RepID=A0A218ZGY2_9HELO|nr:hypothetical protein B2J93_1176 [Marssonina coronariae]